MCVYVDMGAIYIYIYILYIFVYICVYICVYMHTYKEHNETHQTLLERGGGGGGMRIKWKGELVQSALYTCVELSQ
jgi:hypothetical protein